jgi:hypothetical protein
VKPLDNVSASAQDTDMNSTTAPAVTKAQLTERKRGKGGSTVRLTDGRIVVVKDLMQRPNYAKPDRIGVGFSGSGLAFGVSLADVAEVIVG